MCPLWLQESFNGQNHFLFVSAVLLLSSVTTYGQAKPPSDERYFSLVQVAAAFRPILIASGNRLQKAGSEKILAAGTMQFGADGLAARLPVQVALQLPSQVRIDVGGAAIVYDGKNAPQKAPVDQRDLDAVETLIEDSMEGFLRSAESGASVRWLGSGVRDNSAGAAPVFVDVIDVSYTGKLRAGVPQSKVYYFDSSTKLLRRVEYAARPGVNLRVDVSDWKDVQGTKVPFQIERRQNNALTFRLVLSAVQISQGADDSLFLGK